MGGFLSEWATRMDTFGSRTRMKTFSAGWPASSPEVKFYRSPKVQYRYRERGSGPVIVFSVDPPATLEFYDDLFEVFAAHFRVIAVEMPAMGFSATTSDFGFGWRETNDDLACFLRDVAGSGAVLAFSCVAGLAAVDIAVRYPELVDRLVLSQTGDVAAFAKWKAARDPQGILGRPFVGQYVMKRIAPNRMPDWFRLSVGDRSKIEQFCKCADESFQHGALWSLASAYQTYMDPEVSLGRPKQPILALWGLADGSHPPENAESPRRLSGDVTYIPFDDLGHFPELEAPMRVLGLIRDFLQVQEGRNFR